MPKYEKTFKLVCTEDKDGNLELKFENHGFDGMEIIGILETKKSDIVEQTTHPERFKFIREVGFEDGTMAKKVKEGEYENS